MTATTEKKPSLAIEGRLPFENYASEVNIGDLLKMLVNKGVLSVNDYELLVMRGHMVPRLEALDQSNWVQIKAELLAFLDKKNWQFAHPETGPKGKKEEEGQDGRRSKSVSTEEQSQIAKSGFI